MQHNSPPRFEVVPDRKKNAWDLPENLHEFVKTNFDHYLPDPAVKETILDKIPIPDRIGNAKTNDDYLKEMLYEAKRTKVIEHDKNLEKIQQKILNTMGPLGKLWVGVDEVKTSNRSG